MALGVQLATSKFQALNSEGKPVAYGEVYFKDSFTGEPILTYKNSSLTIVNTDPVVLSASGKADIYLADNQYDIVLKDADGAVVETIEDYITVGLSINKSAWREKQVATVASQTDVIFVNPLDERRTMIFKNGVLMEEGATEDYTITPPYTAKFNSGLTIGDEIVAFDSAPTVTKSTLYADGSVPMDPGYEPAIDQDIATKASAATEALQIAQAALPTGSVIMWAGSLANIPEGWALCNGANGTPDLRGRFIYGGDATNTGATGGYANAVNVAHSHTAYSNTTGNHTHTVVVPKVGNNVDQSGSWGGTPTNETKITSAAGSHSHTITVNSSGVSGTNRNLPPYYKLAFIIRVA